MEILYSHLWFPNYASWWFCWSPNFWTTLAGWHFWLKVKCLYNYFLNSVMVPIRWILIMLVIRSRSTLSHFQCSETSAKLIGNWIWNRYSWLPDNELFLTLCIFLSPPRNSTVLNSKVLSVTIKPTPASLSAPIVVEFSHLYNVSVYCLFSKLCFITGTLS